MAKREEQPVIEVPEGLTTSSDYDYIISEDAPEVSMTQFIDEVDPKGEGIKSADLVGESFTLVKAKRVNSSYEDQDHFYFAIIRMHKDGELRHTVFGGKVVVGKLDTAIEAGLEARLVCTYVHQDGGEHGGYYDLL